MNRFASPVLAGLLALSGVALADSGHAGHGAPKAAAASMSEGEVRKVDKDAGKITLKHGPISNLGMPPMTMVFQVKDRALLDKVKAGDKVQFTAEQNAGSYVVTGIEAAK